MNKSNQNYLLTLLLIFCTLNLFGNYAASSQTGRAASAKFPKAEVKKMTANYSRIE